MPKRIVPLTDIKIRNAKPKEKPVALFDGGGLYLLDPIGREIMALKVSV